MSWKSIALGSALVVAVVAGAFYAGAGIGPHPVWAEGASGARGAAYDGSRRHGTGHGVDRLCEADDGAWLDLMVGYTRRRLDLRPDQTPAWQALEAALRDGIATLRTACGTTHAGEGATAPARLAAAEAAMAAGTAALSRVRPAFDAFYATLDDGQKATLEDAVAHRRQR